MADRRCGAIDRRTLLFAGSIALISPCVLAQAQSDGAGAYGAIYPSSDRYKPIIDATLKGIESVVGPLLRRRLVPGQTGPDEIRGWLSAPVDGWFLLGTEARDAIAKLPVRQPAMLGLQYVLSTDRSAYSAVSLDFDPEAAIPELRLLLPRLERLQIAYIKGRDDWIIDRIRNVASKHRLTVLPAPANGLGAATDHFSGMLRYGNPTTDIIWLLGGPDLVTRDTSAHLFQQAFNARFPVFSNRRAWVDDGALLGGEPDFEQHGAQMARALRRAIETGKPQIELTAKVSIALNVRVARRLGIAVTEELRRKVGVLVADD